MFHGGFIFEILDQLLVKFEEKHIDLILSVLRTIGFNLRKDNPTLIKKLLLDIQKKSSDICESTMRYTYIFFKYFNYYLSCQNKILYILLKIYYFQF